MNRRFLLKALLGAPVAVAAAPALSEELLELLSPRTIILPPVGGWPLRSAGQVWAVNSVGGYLYSRKLAEVLRQTVQPLTRFKQFVDVTPGQHFTLDTWAVDAGPTTADRIARALKRSRIARLASNYLEIT